MLKEEWHAEMAALLEESRIWQLSEAERLLPAVRLESMVEMEREERSFWGQVDIMLIFSVNERRRERETEGRRGC